MKMNKKYFLEELKKKTGLNEDDCLKISNVIDDTFIIGQKNKEKMIYGFVENLNIDEAKAAEIYEIAMDIISSSIKEKLKHPFKKD